MTETNPTYAERIVQVCEDTLAAGPMGNKLRGSEYREFIRCRWPLNACMISPKLPPYGKRTIGGDIGQIETSCAVWAGSASFHAGLEWDESDLVEGYRMWSGPMFGNWYQLEHSHPAWAPFPHPPSEGDVFDLGGSHVGICLKHLGGGRWRTAEGGGGDGTKCSISEKRVFDPANPRAWDPSLHRTLRGFFRAAVIGEMLGEPVRDTVPAPCPGDSAPPTAPAFRRTLMLKLPRMTGEDVKAWQKLLGFSDDDQDGTFGPFTDRATRAWQRNHGLKDDGEVGPKTRAKAGL